jgi:AcrR family transcriptional regulator
MIAKGERTRQTILDHAAGVAREVGLEGLTIGRLATELSLSKSGLFAHFRSKEALQIEVLDRAATGFTTQVVRPALALPRGVPRLRGLFERWLEWARPGESGGCVFVAAAAELDDRPGPVRDHLVTVQRTWVDCMARVVRAGMESGAFRTDADPEQVAFDLYGVMLSYHHAARLLKDPRAEPRARRAFEALLARLQKPARTFRPRSR